MAQKIITIKDIAAQLNISVSTVSRALKNNPEISQKTRTKVQELAKSLGYVPNPIAVALKTHKSYNIGIIVPQIVSAFFSTVVEVVEEIADAHGYNVMVISSNERFEKERKAIDIFLANRADGIIVAMSRETMSYEHIKKIQDSGIPLVLFDRTVKELDVSKVVANDADAAYMAVQHLILGGAKKIAIMTGPENMLVGKNRMKGYLKALAENKIDVDPKLIIRCSDLSVSSAKESISNMIANDLPFDAIFAITDDMAIGAIDAIKEKGNINIPQDVAVFGCSDSKRSQYMTPSISTINQYPEKVGKIAADLLFEQIFEGKYSKPREVIVNCDLIVRDSSNREI